MLFWKELKNKIFNSFKLTPWPVLAVVLVVVGFFPSTYWRWFSANEQGSAPKIGQQDINWLEVRNLTDLSLESATVLVVVVPSGEIVGAKKPTLRWPLASLTKLFSIGLLDRIGLAWQGELNIDTRDKKESEKGLLTDTDVASQLPVTKPEVFSGGDLVKASLISSANNAVLSLVKNTSVGLVEFISQMNQTAASQHFNSLNFFEPTGLNPKNSGQTIDVARMALWAWQSPRVKNISGSVSDIVTAKSGQPYRLDNTNELFALKKDFKILASKTGHLSEAGYNLVMEVEAATKKRYLIVLMGAPSKPARESDIFKIMAWLEDKGL